MKPTDTSEKEPQRLNARYLAGIIGNSSLPVKEVQEPRPVYAPGRHAPG